VLSSYRPSSRLSLPAAPKRNPIKDLILGENGSAACIPLAVLADVFGALFDKAQYCAGEFTANEVDGNYRRLEHIHGDLAAGIELIVNTSNQNTTTIVNNDDKNTAALISNSNANKTEIINELRALTCELTRLLTTPEGTRTSSLDECTGQPGFPYSWNKK
jgi:hypothetical protein